MRRTILPALLVAALSFLVFAGTVRNGFVVLDDAEYVTANPLVRRGLSVEGIAWAFTAFRAGNWHPATWLSHMLDVELFGLDPRGHHLVSAALHACSAGVLCAALAALTGAPWRSALAAALFAVHPLRLESVAWAAERKDVLFLLFLLLALLAYTRAVRRSGPPRLAPVAALFALSLTAKAGALTFPLLLLLVDWWPLGRWRPGEGGSRGFAGALPPAALWREKLPLLLLAAAAGAVAYAAQSAGRAVASTALLPVGARVANAVLASAAYLGDTLWPARLSVLRPHPFAVPPWPAWCGALVLVVALTALAWRSRRSQPFLAVGWSWFLASLLPVIGLVQIGFQARADRYTYLPHVGLFLAAVWGGGALARRRRLLPAAAAAGGAAVALLAAVTVAQLPVWRTSGKLFARALALAPAVPPGTRSPGLAYLHNALGVARYEEGRIDEAIAHYRSAVAADSAFAQAKGNLGRALEDVGRESDAEALYREALAIDPRFAEALNNLGGLHLKRGEAGEAVRLLREAAAIDPLQVAIRSNLGAALDAAGDKAGAERELRAAIALDPDYEPARFNLGRFLLDTGRFAEAAGQLRESIRIQPRDPASQASLAEALARGGRAAEAAEAHRRALELSRVPAPPPGPAR